MCSPFVFLTYRYQPPLVTITIYNIVIQAGWFSALMASPEKAHGKVAVGAKSDE